MKSLVFIVKLLDQSRIPSVECNWIETKLYCYPKWTISLITQLPKRFLWSPTDFCPNLHWMWHSLSLFLFPSRNCDSILIEDNNGIVDNKSVLWIDSKYSQMFYRWQISGSIFRFIFRKIFSRNYGRIFSNTNFLVSWWMFRHSFGTCRFHSIL